MSGAAAAYVRTLERAALDAGALKAEATATVFKPSWWGLSLRVRLDKRTRAAGAHFREPIALTGRNSLEEWAQDVVLDPTGWRA